jgi:hypothetical protein
MKSVSKRVIHHVMSKLHDNARVMSNVHVNVCNKIYDEVHSDIYTQVRRQITLQLKQNI